MARKRTTSNNFGKQSDSPLDAKQRAIAEQEEKLRVQMEKYRRLIEQAPKLAEERKRIQREEIINRASRIEKRFGSAAALPDRRYEVNAGAPARQRQLRAERNRGRAMFFFLLFAFAAALAWLYFTIVHA